VADNPRTPPAARGAIRNLLSGGYLTGTERQAIADLAVSGRSWLTEEEQKALNQALAYDMERRKKWQRELVVENFTGEPLTVWVHYYAPDAEGEWSWLPGPPKETAKALRYVVKPGAVTYLLDHGGAPIAASRVRLWAATASGKKWSDYQQKDLWLVPEVGDGEQHYYHATAMEMFRVRIYAPQGATELAALARK
jgi:hypothetical protein